MEQQTMELQATPTKMTTRGGQRVNYNELNNSGGGGYGSDQGTDDGVFRSPKPTTRGIKRKNDDGLYTPVTAKRGRPRGTPGSARGGVRSVTRRPAAATTESAGPDIEDGLFNAVKSGKNMDGNIDDWIDDYEKFPEGALLKLQQFLLHCCGCRGVLTSSMVHGMEYSEIVRRMTEDFDEDSGDYPLVMTGPHWKKFRSNLHTMLYHLIEKCKSSIIYDDRMMDSVIQLLTSLADSQVRAFRHTSTFAVDVTIEIVSKKEKNLKQIEAEKAKLKNNAGTNEKLDVLLQNKNDYEERAEEVRQQLSYIFKSVFVHRYRDVLPDTRAICITELGNWMMVYPEHFLDDSYLKYIGWSLHDKVADVRLKCISALLPLYDKQDTWPKLELFTNKFKERLVSMVLDKDNEVAMQTCKLMTSVYRVLPSVLKPDDCVPIYELVYANHRGLAVAAGEFLNTKVFQHSARSRASSVSSNAGRGTSENARLIKDFVQFYIEGEVHDHASYIVDALIDTNPMLKDWQAMVDLLLGDDMEKNESQLIEILVCAVKQAATGECPIGRSVAKRGVQTNKENKVLMDDRAKLSEALIPTIPQILKKFIADKDKVANLITIPLYFYLDMYLAGRLESHLNELMHVLDMVVEKHTDEEILCTVAEVITTFSNNTPVAQHTETATLKLIDQLALQVRHTSGRFANEQNCDEEDEAALLAAFKKVTAFVTHIDMKKWDLWDTVMNLLANSEGRIPQDVLDKCLVFLFLQLNWDLNRLVKDNEPNKNDAIKKLKKKRDQFIHIVDDIIKESASGVELAFQCLADVLIVFSDTLKDNNSALEGLVVKVDNNFINRLKSFVTDNVFSNAGNDTSMDQQQRIDLMHKKRKILTQFSKMVIHGVFKVVDASTILTKYSEYYSDYGDIMKQILYRCRDLDFVGCAKAVVNALRDQYEYIKLQSGLDTVDPLSEQFNRLRDLSKRFASAFGNDHVKNREAVASIHRDGIQYALSGYDPNSTTKRGNKPTNISFLEIIMEFSPKLLKQDKLAVIRYLEKHGGTPNVKDKVWEPYTLYKGSLTERNADDVSSLQSFSVAPTPKSTRGRGKARGGRASPATSEFD